MGYSSGRNSSNLKVPPSNGDFIDQGQGKGREGEQAIQHLITN